jgi:mRNA-degrading endonuclease RelE of RelBE toxin-antitoxin system
MSYQVIIPKPVQKQLDDLPDDIFKRAIEKLDGLKDNQLLNSLNDDDSS